ncbi:methyltransferase [Candidatus Gracilibacteria bacterium]|nr:methyltransferase [Candidatus Gracilibacteria bacterium]
MNLRFWSVAFWKEAGYNLSSSPYLVRRLVSLADISDAHIIVELGAGEGQVTGHILEKKSKNTRLIVIENDHNKFLELSQKYGEQCEIHEISAAHIDSIVDKNSVDVIISTLPLGSISHPGVGHILAAAEGILKKGGKFIQYQYVMANKKDVKKYFHIDHIYWEPRNIGPTFIYEAHKK